MDSKFVENLDRQLLSAPAAALPVAGPVRVSNDDDSIVLAVQTLPEQGGVEEGRGVWAEEGFRV